MNRYSELKINNIVLIRARNRRSLERSIQKFGLTDVVNKNNAYETVDIIAAGFPSKFGSLFEGKKL